MGLVLAATDPRLGRRVALKLLLNTQADAALDARLALEARAMAQLNHPNVVTLYELGEWAGRRYLAMEHVEGVTLDRWLASARRSPDEVLHAVLQAGRGLAAAHGAGLVHRDVKPTNLLVGADGRVRVTDFGLSRLEGGVVQHSTPGLEATAHGTIIGTPAWMAPEQLDGQRADAASDQFALCVVLAEALTGHRPWMAPTSDGLRAAQRHPPRLDGVPRPLRAVLRRGLCESPAARFESMTALLDALEVAPRRAKQLKWALLVGVLAAAVVATWWALRADVLELKVDQMEFISVPCLVRVAVGNPDVLDVRTLGQGNLMLLGTGPGETTLATWDCHDERRTRVVHVTGAPRAASPDAGEQQ
jgi:serine/threonine-protein kinase